MNNLDKYRSIFEESLGVDMDVLGGDLVFGGVEQWDSVSHIAMVSEIEDEFDVMLEPNEILHYGSYLNGIEILKRHGVDFG